MTAGELAIVLGTVLCAVGFAALVVVLLRVLDTLRALRGEVEHLRSETEHLRSETRPLLLELRSSVEDARDDLVRFDRVLGSAEAISGAVAGTSRVARVALSTPMIKTVALASGTGRTARRLRRKERGSA